MRSLTGLISIALLIILSSCIPVSLQHHTLSSSAGREQFELGMTLREFGERRTTRLGSAVS